MNKTVMRFLHDIASQGGSANTPAQKVARERNARKAADARRIVDEFSHLPRLERYKARKARRKLLEMKDNA